MQYKMVTFDLDGTLIGDGVHIPQSALNAIDKLFQHQILVAIATGRSIFVVPNCLQEMSMVSYLVTANGARLVDKVRNVSDFPGDMVDEKVNEILDMSRCFGGRSLVFFRNLVVYEEKVMRRERQAIINFRRAEGADNLVIASDVVPYIGRYGPVEKITLEYDIEHKDALLDNIQRIGNFELACEKNVVEITNVGISKCSGLEMVCKNISIRMDEVVSFGDSENDLSILKNVGLGVAMGNSAEKIKRQADYVTDRYDQDGIANAVNKIFGF